MSTELTALVITALSIGFFHTLFGPDHYLPFIVLAKAGGWSRAKTVFITIGCGVAHVLSSVALGFIGIALGFGVSKLEDVESARGDLAAWLLMIFGAGYLLWGAYRLLKKKSHHQWHFHKTEQNGIHSHIHDSEHRHSDQKKESKNLTPWVLLLIFVFGPCEPLIPVLMYPAARNNFFDLLVVTGVFSVCTIGTMILMVILLLSGIKLIPTEKMERYTHVLAGGTILLCGMAIRFLEL